MYGQLSSKNVVYAAIVTALHAKMNDLKPRSSYFMLEPLYMNHIWSDTIFIC